jgi:predicted phage terminase large subunit-like protein
LILSDHDLQKLKRQLPNLDAAQKARVLQLLQEREKASSINEAREHFLPYMKMMWPDAILGAHHTIIAEKFDQLVNGDINRLIINIAPRHSKSEMTSWLLPTWFIGKNPRAKLMQCMNTQDLASGFGRRVRNTLSKEARSTDEKGFDAYHNIFPQIDIAKDSSASFHWHTNTDAEYYAVGVGGKIAGRGADLLVIDDPSTEQEAKQAETNPQIFDDVYNWYVYGPRQRLQPNAKIVVVMTRWSKRDLTGRLIKKMQEGDSELNDRWHVVEFPAILDQGTPSERSLWPAYWPLKTLQATREALPVPAWSSQYLQQPTSEAAAILKREYWRTWGGTNEKCPGPRHLAAWENLNPPACDYTIASWDCAASKNDRSHPSAYTLWGVFKAEDPTTGKEVNNIILLSAFQARMEFPELKKKAKAFYDEDQPDTLLIENKSAGMQLLQEFRTMGIPAESFTGSSRGSKQYPNDKIARANMISDIFASRFVWAPERRFADEVITQCADFPSGEADDLLDSTVQAMLRFREGGFIRTANDEEDEDTGPRQRRRRMY